MKAIERHRQTWQGKSDEWLFEKLDNELKQKVEEIHRLLAENEAVLLSMEEILRDAVRRKATYQVQFADYDLDTWTVPCQLTENRMEKLLDDGSIRKVRLELEM